MSHASAQELLLLSALQECRVRLDDARTGAADYEANRAALAEARGRVQALEDELARERERTEGVRIVLRALAASLRPFGLRRRRFLARIARAGRDTPQSGPQSARHPVLLAESRRVLGREADAARDPAG